LIIGVEKLTSSEQEFCRQSLKMTGEGGALIGAVRSDHSLQLRPVVLMHGSLRLLRVLPEARTGNQQSINLLDRYASSLVEIESIKDFHYGVTSGQFWCFRSYFKQEFHSLPKHKKIDFIPKLLKLVSRLHQQKLWHGNIVPNNIFCSESGQVHLVDFGLRSFESALNTSSAQPDFEQERSRDLTQLLSVIKQVLPETKVTVISDIISAVQNQDLVNDITVDQLIERLYPELLERKTPFIQSNLKSGRLIQPPRRQTKVLDDTQIKSQKGKVQPNTSESKNEPVVEPEVSPDSNLESKADKSSSGWDTLFYLGVFLVLIASTYYYFESRKIKLDEPQIEESQEFISEGRLEAYWESGEIELMEQVAVRAAAESDRSAQNVIIRSILGGTEPAEVAFPLVKTATEQPWADQYSVYDRQALFQIALSRLLDPSKRIEIDFSSLHPGLIFSLIATLPVDQQIGWLDLVDSKRFFELPGLFGEFFMGLDQLGVNQIGSPIFRSGTHLVTGNISSRLLASFLAETESESERIQRLALLLPTINNDTELAKDLYTSLLELENYNKYKDWFNNSEPISWSDKPALLKLYLLLSSGKGLSWSDEELADLLTFPSQIVRSTAIELLGERFADERSEPMLEFLGSTTNQLRRDHTVSLVLALLSTDEAVFDFLQQWFDTKPDPVSVLQLLISRSSFEDLDYFSVEAARYLKDSEWSASPEQLAGLIGHPEALARSVAYARLNPRVEKERQLLEQMAQVEPIERIRVELERKLSLSEGR